MALMEGQYGPLWRPSIIHLSETVVKVTYLDCDGGAASTSALMSMKIMIDVQIAMLLLVDCWLDEITADNKQACIAWFRKRGADEEDEQIPNINLSTHHGSGRAHIFRCS